MKRSHIAAHGQVDAWNEENRVMMWTCFNFCLQRVSFFEKDEGELGNSLILLGLGKGRWC